MKRALLILLLATACFGQGLTLRSPLRDIAPVAAASGAHKEGFEGTGTPSGWTVNAGTPDFDSTTQTKEGSQSLAFNTAGDETKYTTTDTYLAFAVRFGGYPSVQTSFVYPNATDAGFLRMETDGRLTVFLKTGTSATTADALSLNTWYYVWVKHSTTEAWVAFNQDDKATEPTMGNKYAQCSGTGGYSIDQHDFYRAGAFGSVFYIDDYISSPTDPGTNY